MCEGVPAVPQDTTRVHNCCGYKITVDSLSLQARNYLEAVLFQWPLLSGGHWIIDIRNGHFIHAGLESESECVCIYILKYGSNQLL